MRLLNATARFVSLSFLVAIALTGPCLASEQTSCGATAKDGIASAKKALASTEPDAERKALACLIEVVSRLESNAPIQTHLDGQEVLHLPQYSGGAQK